MLMLVLVLVVLLPLLSSGGGLFRTSTFLLLAAVTPEWCKASSTNCADWTGTGECKKEEDNCEADEENWSDYRGIHWVRM
jgi:hypothetical protein